MTAALEITDLKKTYRNGFEALKGVTLSVRPGEFFALLGPNGAGKSTLIGVITSLINKTGGSVSVFGHDIDQDFSAAKTCLGVVPQEFNFNVWEPIEETLVNQAGYYGIPRKLAFERAEQRLRQLGLWDKRREIGRNLSGGMKRRMMIARALIHEPRLLILDEPTAGVDIEMRHLMWTFLREINEQGTTIILTTHYLEEAENLCKHIAIIDRGELIENTSMRELLTRLNMETFVLDLKQALQAPPALNGHTARLLDANTLEVDVCREFGINQLFTDLANAGIEVTSLRNKSSRLEQLFMRLLKDGENR